MSNVIFDRYDFLSLESDFGIFIVKVFYLIILRYINSTNLKTHVLGLVGQDQVTLVSVNGLTLSMSTSSAHFCGKSLNACL